MKKIKLVSKIAKFTDKLCEELPEYNKPDGIIQLRQRLEIEEYSVSNVYLMSVIQGNMKAAYRAGFKKAKKLLK